MEYQCVVLDIDGTLLNSEGELSRENRQAVKAVQRQGIPVILATGRRITRARPWLRALEIKTPAVIHNGAVVYSGVEDKITFQKGIEQDVAAAVVSVLRQEKVPYVVYTGASGGECLVMERDQWEDHRRLVQRFVGDAVEPVPCLDPRDEPLKIALVGRSSELQRHLIHWQQRMGTRTNMMIFQSRDGLFTGVEFVAKGVSKAAGAERILAAMGLDLSQALAIGDDVNDMELIERAALGIAVENGDPRLKQAAARVTLANDHHGVARALEDFILSRK